MKHTDTSLAAVGDVGGMAGAKPVVVRRAEEVPPGEGVAAQAAAEGVGDGINAAVREAEAAAMALSPAQQRAIVRLTSGSTVVGAAEAAGVGRTTLYRWLKEDPAFIAAYNAWQRDVLATARGRMIGLVNEAVTALSKAMSRGDGRLAMRVLEQMGVAAPPAAGPTDVEEVKREQALAARENELEIKKAETVAASEEEQLELALACGPMLAGMGLANPRQARKRGGKGK